MKNRKGFTIVELVIVIAVIAILAAVLIPTFSGVINNANASAALQEAKTSLTNVLSGNTNGSLTSGTKFLIDYNNDGNSFEYAYDYNGNKLTAMDEIPADITAAVYPQIVVGCKLDSSENVTVDPATLTLVAKAYSIEGTLTLGTKTADGSYPVTNSGTEISGLKLFVNTDLEKNIVICVPAIAQSSESESNGD